jgi:intracellular multiplication protein IcmT
LAYWRDSARPARFFFVDYRAAFPLLLFLLHIKLWTFIAAIVTMVILAVIEHYGFTVNVFLRWLRTLLAGSRKFSSPWWKL